MNARLACLASTVREIVIDEAFGPCLYLLSGSSGPYQKRSWTCSPTENEVGHKIKLYYYNINLKSWRKQCVNRIKFSSFELNLIIRCIISTHFILCSNLVEAITVPATVCGINVKTCILFHINVIWNDVKTSNGRWKLFNRFRLVSKHFSSFCDGAVLSWCVASNYCFQLPGSHNKTFRHV